MAAGDAGRVLAAYLDGVFCSCFIWPFSGDLNAVFSGWGSGSSRVDTDTLVEAFVSGDQSVPLLIVFMCLAKLALCVHRAIAVVQSMLLSPLVLVACSHIIETSEWPSPVEAPALLMAALCLTLPFIIVLLTVIIVALLNAAGRHFQCQRTRGSVDRTDREIGRAHV